MFHPASVRTTAVLLALSAPALAQWQQRSPATVPTARTGAAMTYDFNNGAVLMFGGSFPNNNQTWLYDGTDWTQLTPAASPTARSGMQMVHDLARGVTVLYGGLATNISIPPPNSDTWEWDGANWTQASPVANAGPRYRHAMGYDMARGRTVMYGGATSQLPGMLNSQTWEYDGTTWAQIVTVGSPGPLDRPAMCYHAGIGKIVMFGGHTGASFTNATWTYDGTTWTQVPVVGNWPTARNAATLTYDTVRNVSVLHGGQDNAGSRSDTWTFDGTTWVEQPFATQAVRDHMSAFLPSSEQVVKFGGFVAAPNTLSNQTWEFGSGLYGVGCVGTNGVPGLVATSAPQLGQPWSLQMSNLNPSINIGIIAFGFTKLPGIDLTFVLDMPGCLAFTTADLLLLEVGAGGAATWTWPAVTGLVGDNWYAQALSVDPTVNGFGCAISNAIYATIGS